MSLRTVLHSRERLIVVASLVLLLFVCFLLYFPGLNGEFIFDDSLNIVINRQVHMQNLTWEEIRTALYSGVASDVGRPLSQLSFALNHLATGLNPGYFKLTNVIIHLLTALALYFLTCQLLTLRSAQAGPFRIPHKVLALIIAAAWTLHPLQVSTVLYVVQRMTQLSALFSVLALLVYCRLRLKPALSDVQILLSHAAVGALILLGILCKENAALAVLYIGAIEFCLLANSPKTREQGRFVYSFCAIFMVLPGIAALAFLLADPGYILDPYSTREFTLLERLLSECRIVWDYIRWILIPDTREFVLYHENYTISRGLFDPPSTALALLGIIALVVSVPLLRKRLPWLCFGIAFFLVGHILESTVVALELVFEHRNYLPAYGLLFALFATLNSSSFNLLSSRFTGVFAGLVLLLFIHSTYGETAKWSSTPAHVLGMYRYAPDSRRINYSMVSLYSRLGETTQNMDYVREAQKYALRMTELAPDSLIPFAAYVRVTSWLGEQPSPEIREQFLTNVRRSIFIPGDILELLTLINCFYSGTCANLGLLIPDIYRTIGDSTVLAPIQKQHVLDEIALSLLGRFERVADAVGVYYFAESLSSELSLVDIKLIMLELDRRQPDAARAHLDKSRRKTTSDPSLRLALDDLEDDLNSAAASPTVVQ